MSGAWLNLEKSTILLLDEEPHLAWYANSGCKVAQLGEIINYLGCPMGCKILVSKEAKFLLDKVRKRVFHWSNQLLSLQGRLVLLKHVLRAVPVFHLMALMLNKGVLTS